MEDATTLTVGKRIRWSRKQAGLSQDALAALIGTTRQVIIKWEHDRHLPNASSRERLAQATEQSPDFFRDETPHVSEFDEDEEAALQRRARELVSPFQAGDGRRAARRVSGTRRGKAGG